MGGGNAGNAGRYFSEGGISKRRVTPEFNNRGCDELNK